MCSLLLRNHKMQYHLPGGTSQGAWTERNVTFSRDRKASHRDYISSGLLLNGHDYGKLLGNERARSLLSLPLL